METMDEQLASWLARPFHETDVATNATDEDAERAPYLNRRFVHAAQTLIRQVPTSEQLDHKPFVLECVPPLPPMLRVYVYTVTTSDAERQAGAHRVQLTNAVPLPDREGRYQFDRSDGALPLLAGYVHEWDVFVLWDAELHDVIDGFPSSKGVQVKQETILAALSKTFSTQERSLRPSGKMLQETVVAARASKLIPALRERFRLSRSALLDV